jgi:tellurium resistance protein TerD
MLTLSLNKGQPVQNLKLNLSKGQKFSVELSWDSVHDLDAHALAAVNSGNGAKVADMAQVLSYATSPKQLKGQSPLKGNPNGSFSTADGGLTHSGDCRDGTLTGVDETITVDPNSLNPEVNEIPIFVTIYSPSKPNVTFGEVKEAGISIKDESGKVLGQYRLSNEFAGFNAVQMGSLIKGQSGWEYAPVGSGFNGDLNTVLANFS